MSKFNLYRKLDFLAYRWIMKRSLVIASNGKMYKFFREKYLEYYDNVLKTITDAQANALTLSENTWDKQVAYELQSNLKAIKIHFYDEYRSAKDNNMIDTRFFKEVVEPTLKKDFSDEDD